MQELTCSEILEVSGGKNAIGLAGILLGLISGIQQISEMADGFIDGYNRERREEPQPR